jgi:hypothetical protein
VILSPIFGGDLGRRRDGAHHGVCVQLGQHCLGDGADGATPTGAVDMRR